jgi:hypothetical protein
MVCVRLWVVCPVTALFLPVWPSPLPTLVRFWVSVLFLCVLWGPYVSL